MSRVLARAGVGNEPADTSDPIERARQIAERVLAPRANQTDQAVEPPIDNFRHLGAAGLLGLTTPVQYGGLGAAGRVVHDCLDILATACGVTGFLAERHLMAVTQVAHSANAALKAELLPRVAAGSCLLASGTTHLRPDRPAAVRVEHDRAGYRLHGTVAWVSGWGLMHEVLLGGVLFDGRLVYGVAPFVASDELVVSPPMSLCALNASATVSLTCRGLLIPAARCVGVYEDVGWGWSHVALSRITRPLGVAAAAIGLLRALAERGDRAVATAAEALAGELAAIQHEVGHCAEALGTSAARGAVLSVVAWSHDLSVRAALAAVVATGGRANDREHTAQRLYREAMFYALYWQRPGVQSAILDRLAASASRAGVGAERAEPAAE